MTIPPVAIAVGAREIERGHCRSQREREATARERERPLLLVAGRCHWLLSKLERERDAPVEGGERERPLPLSEPERESEAAVAVAGRCRN